ncbi:hypothetical protein ElyMa_004227300 [Elysia marginata]|uniref:Uncharacterized protein n=1 Tax=Elysia marginata TaxID=1093978 RepID=A0AAV4GR04_9GAST|nr:hypothetical protein ElyMa_004227300 [Elysia marginata]
MVPRTLFLRQLSAHAIGGRRGGERRGHTTTQYVHIWSDYVIFYLISDSDKTDLKESVAPAEGRCRVVTARDSPPVPHLGLETPDSEFGFSQ